MDSLADLNTMSFYDRNVLRGLGDSAKIRRDMGKDVCDMTTNHSSPTIIGILYVEQRWTVEPHESHGIPSKTTAVRTCPISSTRDDAIERAIDAIIETTEVEKFIGLVRYNYDSNHNDGGTTMSQATITVRQQNEWRGHTDPDELCNKIKVLPDATSPDGQRYIYYVRNRYSVDKSSPASIPTIDVDVAWHPIDSFDRTEVVKAINTILDTDIVASWQGMGYLPKAHKAVTPSVSHRYVDSTPRTKFTVTLEDGRKREVCFVTNSLDEAHAFVDGYKRAVENAKPQGRTMKVVETIEKVHRTLVV